MIQLVTKPDYEQYCQGALENPYPLFDLLRERDPIHWSDRMKLWLVTRYDDVHAGLRDTKRLSSNREGMYTDLLNNVKRQSVGPLVAHLNRWMLNLNGDEHTRFRRLVNIAFTPRMIEQLAPEIEQTIDRLLEQLHVMGRFDFVEQFCFPLPAQIICRMLGMPPEKVEFLHEHSRALADFSGAAGPSLNDRVDCAAAGLSQLTAYFDGLIEQRRSRGGSDLVSAMLAAEQNGDRLSKDDLFAMCVFLYIAGHSTTAGVIANSAYLLAQHPQQFQKLKSDPTRYAEPTVEEVLRLESPVPRSVRRATESFEWHGRRIEVGQTLMLLLGAANRDPRQFESPDRFDIERSPNKHLAFGFGKHFCLGAPLAQMEAVAVLKKLAVRMPNLRLAGEPRWVTRHGLRSLAHLPMQVG